MLRGRYDQSWGSKNQGVGTYGDVHRSGGIGRGKPINQSEAQIIRRNYYAATSYSDAQLGRLLDALDAHSLTGSTLVVIFGDHVRFLGRTQRPMCFQCARTVLIVDTVAAL